MQEGWKCPVCGKVNAPWKESCGCDTHRMPWITDYPVYPLGDDGWGNKRDTSSRPWEPPYTIT